MSYTQKPLENLNVLDDFLMNAITSTPEIGEAFCCIVLPVLLQKKLGRIKVISQRTVSPHAPDLRGIRMDVEVEEFEEDNEIPVSIYDLEPNSRRDIQLPRHNRFYQARIDGRSLKSGEEDFRKLPNLYILTITDYDPFGYDYMMYRIRNQCDEIEGLEYDDGLEFLYFYTKGSKGGNQSIKALLQYIENSTPDNAVDDTTQRLHQIVEQITIRKGEHEHMTFGNLIDYQTKKVAQTDLVENIDKLIKNLQMDLETACSALEITVEDYHQAKEFVSRL